jgi:hypothetical protein
MSEEIKLGETGGDAINASLGHCDWCGYLPHRAGCIGVMLAAARLDAGRKVRDAMVAALYEQLRIARRGVEQDVEWEQAIKATIARARANFDDAALARIVGPEKEEA